MRTTAFNSYWFPPVEDGERVANCVETACKMLAAMWTADVEEVKLPDKAMTILCDLLAAKLLEVVNFLDFTLLGPEVWTHLEAIPRRAKMSSQTKDVLVTFHVQDSSFHKARWEVLTDARKPM